MLQVPFLSGGFERSNQNDCQNSHTQKNKLLREPISEDGKIHPITFHDRRIVTKLDVVITHQGNGKQPIEGLIIGRYKSEMF